MRYKQPGPITPAAAVRVFRAGQPYDIAETLVSLALYEQDADFTLLWCLFFLRHSDDNVAEVAATCIGHIARIHQRINTAAVVPILKIIRAEGRIAGRSVAGTADDALDDIKMFCPKPKRSKPKR